MKRLLCNVCGSYVEPSERLSHRLRCSEKVRIYFHVIFNKLSNFTVRKNDKKNPTKQTMLHILYQTFNANPSKSPLLETLMAC